MTVEMSRSSISNLTRESIMYREINEWQFTYQYKIVYFLCKASANQTKMNEFRLFLFEVIVNAAWCFASSKAGKQLLVFLWLSARVSCGFSSTFGREAIALNSDRNTWLTIISPTAGGTCCSNCTDRTSVAFGVDMRTGCTIR